MLYLLAARRSRLFVDIWDIHIIYNKPLRRRVIPYLVCSLAACTTVSGGKRESLTKMWVGIWAKGRKHPGTIDFADGKRYSFHVHSDKFAQPDPRHFVKGDNKVRVFAFM